MKKYLTEVLGTFALVFCGTAAIVVNDITGGVITHPGVAAVWGLIVIAAIYAFGHISGAHINPAVTIAFAVTDRFHRQDTLPYILAQLIGAFLASTAVRFIFGAHETLGGTIPYDTWQQTFVLEVILTYLLMVVILFASQNKDVNKFTGIAVGMTVWLEALFAGPISGASMNPARSLAPGIVSGSMDHLWVYVAAPVIGSVLASFTWMYLKNEDD